MVIRIYQTLVLLTVLACCRAISADEAKSSEEILSSYNEWVEAANAKDIDWWATFIDAQAVFLPPGNPALETTDAIVDYYADSFRDINFSLDCAQKFVEVSASNDFAWARGTCNATFTTPDGELGSGSSKWTKVWVRTENGEWKCRLNTWNYNE